MLVCRSARSSSSIAGADTEILILDRAGGRRESTASGVAGTACLVPDSSSGYAVERFVAVATPVQYDP